MEKKLPFYVQKVGNGPEVLYRGAEPVIRYAVRSDYGGIWATFDTEAEAEADCWARNLKSAFCRSEV